MAQKLRPQAETLSGTSQPNFIGYQLASIIAKRAPTTADTGYALGQIWVDKIARLSYQLSAVSAGSASWNLTSISSTASFPGTLTTAGTITATNGNLVLGTAGNKLSIATGTNASIGTSAAMTGGTITISTTAVTASSKIFLTAVTPGGTQGTLSVGTIVAGTSFVINSSSGSDTSTVNWLIIN